ncbi:MAG: DNA (cytosine-5-)-methyltransferase [Smithella sp.]
MNHASLFSGIGGFDLAAEWMGWNNVLSCEIDQFCNKVLKYHFPNAIHYEDIKTTDFTIHRGQIDILTGGFPCQPFSLAGKRRGSEDDRHLWPEMLRAIREIQPRWIVGENVFGLTNWNGWVVFREVLSDLENEGYEVQPFIIPACAVNAPHRRDRVWIVAHRKGERLSKWNGKQSRNKAHTTVKRYDSCQNGTAADTDSTGSKMQRELSEPSREKGISDNIPGWYNFPTQSPLRSRNDGVPGGLDVITVSKLRNESIKCYGNAIVPQVALQIFKSIQQYDNINL